MQYFRSLKPAQDESGITEIIISDKGTSLSLLLPTLAHLSQEAGDRWFTWIAPQGISRELLSRYGFDLRKVRIVQPRRGENILMLLSEALAAGNSNTVVASPGPLPSRAVKNLEQAAYNGKSRGLLIRYRYPNTVAVPRKRRNSQED